MHLHVHVQRLHVHVTTCFCLHSRFFSGSSCIDLWPKAQCQSPAMALGMHLFSLEMSEKWWWYKFGLYSSLHSMTSVELEDYWAYFIHICVWCSRWWMYKCVHAWLRYQVYLCICMAKLQSLTWETVNDVIHVHVNHSHIGSTEHISSLAQGVLACIVGLYSAIILVGTVNVWLRSSVSVLSSDVRDTV